VCATSTCSCTCGVAAEVSGPNSTLRYCTCEAGAIIVARLPYQGPKTQLKLVKMTSFYVVQNEISSKPIVRKNTKENVLETKKLPLLDFVQNL
jgi:hypothetical protein